MFSTASTGTYIVTIDGSELTGSTNTIYNSSLFTVRVGSSKLAGGLVVLNGGTVTCSGVHDENYIFSANTCP